MAHTFSNQKYQFGKILESFGMEEVGIFYHHLEHIDAIVVYFMSIW
jgi:hypothetical protein